MFPSFLPDSYFARLISRLDTADQTVADLATAHNALSAAHDALDGRVNTVEIGQGTANGRIADLEGLADSHNTRIAAYELWASELANPLDKIEAQSNMPSVAVGRINLISATNVRAIADKVDAIIDSLRQRQIIEYST